MPIASPPDVRPGPISDSRPVLTPRPTVHKYGIPTVACARGHYNDPWSEECRICRSDLSGARPVDDAAPHVVACVIFDDGTRYDLRLDVTLGRAPDDEAKPGYTSEGTEAIALSGRFVSRRHLTIGVSGWSLRIRDAGSANGTYIIPAGQRSRRLVSDSIWTRLSPGDTILFGERLATVVPVPESSPTAPPPW